MTVMTAPTGASQIYTTTAGTELHYLQAGTPTGPLVLCLHGLGGSTETFKPLLPYIPQIFRVVLLDFPGFGQSPFQATTHAISIASHVADVVDFIIHLQGSSSSSETSKVIIIGHSLGAIVALHVAAERPEIVGGLALLGVGRAAGHIPAARERMRALAAVVRSHGLEVAAETASQSNFYTDSPQRKADTFAQDAVRKAVLASNCEAYAQTCEAIVDLAHRDPPYEKIVAPAVFIAGDQDMISPVQRSQELAELLGGTAWVDVVRSGHQPILEDLSGVKQSIDKLMGSAAVWTAAKGLRNT